MFIGIILTFTILLFFAFFFIYKRDTLMSIFSLNAAAPSAELRNQLEQTADTIIKRLENHIDHLEYLLEEADIRIAALSEKIQQSQLILESGSDILLHETTSQAENYSSADNKLQNHPSEPILPGTSTQTVRACNCDMHINNLPEQTENSSQGKDAVSSDKHRLIQAMADQGCNVLEIAKATGMGKGEIMLRLQLNKK